MRGAEQREVGQLAVVLFPSVPNFPTDAECAGKLIR
jgi:hypothetical protein